jgi:hypothetical protein
MARKGQLLRSKRLKIGKSFLNAFKENCDVQQNFLQRGPGVNWPACLVGISKCRAAGASPVAVNLEGSANILRIILVHSFNSLNKVQGSYLVLPPLP